MPTHLTALPRPPASPRTGDHALGFAVAILVTVAGAILTPFLALAWVALQPVLPLLVALRARGKHAGVAPRAAARAAA